MSPATATPGLGDAYRFMGRDVVVIQCWDDPFGRKMLRFRTVDDQPEAEDGMREALFLADAEPLAPLGSFPE